MRPSQTPASRKFAPPSSSTSNSRTGYTSRFIRPGQPPSSPFPRTPFSGLTQQNADDEIIEDDLDDNYHEDAVVEHLPSGASPDASSVNLDRPAANKTVVEDQIKGQISRLDLQHRDLPAAHATIDHVAKRRKVFHGFTENIEDEFDDFSDFSSSPLPVHALTPSNGNPVASTLIGEEALLDVHIPQSSLEIPNPEPESLQIEPHTSSSPNSTSTISPAKDYATPKHRGSRFRYVPTQAASPYSSNDLNLPSFQSRLLNASTANAPHLHGPRPDLDFTLPDAFSPSRKRGNQQYLRNGHAETVRGWILDLAARANSSPAQSKVKTEPSTDESLMQSNSAEGPGQRHFFVLQIILKDRNGRFIVVRTDDRCAIWVLLDPERQSKPQARPSVLATSKLDSVSLGAKVAVKGGESMTWTLEHGMEDLGGEKCQVAVLWDVFQ